MYPFFRTKQGSSEALLGLRQQQYWMSPCGCWVMAMVNCRFRHRISVRLGVGSVKEMAMAVILG
ncbi:hypothetical protein DN53_00310 [Flagellimonas olearia]|uniref:Uncharacterized protein n=1 Tax=Flagellimonas olearia TaxID=552546 RepID=A0A444VPG6_9FLAO|nr:hypothetical protein DN53_00310 [Allomuricauda olearia]